MKNENNPIIKIYAIKEKWKEVKNDESVSRKSVTYNL